MILRYSNAQKVFCINASEMTLEDIQPVKSAGFQWYDAGKLWTTVDIYRAANLFFASHCKIDDIAFAQLAVVMTNIRLSRTKLASGSKIPAPKGLKYIDYQSGGIVGLCNRFNSGKKAALLADPMGLGKTIQAAGVINYNMYDPSRVLVVCPASLRLNWARELDKWLSWKCEPVAVLGGNATVRSTNGPLIVSYELTLNDLWFDTLMCKKWDLIIFDESHYLKNPEAKRTQNCLECLSSQATHTLFMSGTPIPNHAHEFYAMLSNVAPDVTGGLTERQFTNRFTTGQMDTFGWVVTGGRNHEELSCRLRGSGFMIRRDKREVLPQLPPERHSLIVFPQNKGTAEVVKKEQDNVKFSSEEILRAGEPLGYGALPELRREMGVEKLPDSISWIKDQLDSGLEKVVVFGYHKEVLEGLQEGLKGYGAVLIYGPTPQAKRQAYVDQFQSDPNIRVIIGGWLPLGTGWTLTAADTVIMVECSFRPLDNDQCADRVIRIGQTAEGVNIYYLVVEGSIDASVMSQAAKKQYHIKKIID